jgi:hypothetical protein
MYPTHTLLAQVAADRTADAQLQAANRRQRRTLRSRRTWTTTDQPATRSTTSVTSRREARPASA